MSAGSSFGGMWAAPAISAMVIALSGEPRTWYLPSVSSMSSGAASSSAAQARLLLAERREVEVLEQLVQRAVVVARVVDDAERGLERELLLGDEVLAPQLQPVHAELVGEPVHAQLDPVRGLRPPCAADRVSEHLVCEDAGEVEVDRWEAVAAAHHGEAQLRDERREQLLVRAEVGDDPHLAGGERGVALRAELHVVDLVAAMVARRHVLGAGLYPLDGPAEPLGERQHQGLLAVCLELRAEAAADVWGYHPQLVLGDAEHAREHESGDVRDLCC